MKARLTINWMPPMLLSAAILLCLATTNSIAFATGPYLPPGSSGDSTADGVLGQFNFVENQQNYRDGRGVETSFSGIGAIAVDKSVSPNRVLAVDNPNNRVLGWNTVAAFTSHAAANIVFGQPSVLSGKCNQNSGSSAAPTAGTLCSPGGVAVDSAGRVYIADTGNNRVLEYNAPFTTDRVADDVFGQFGSFETKR